MKPKRLRICIIGKTSPIQGGVSRDTFDLASALARIGHKVWLVTNADQVEPQFRMVFNKSESKKRQLRFKNGGTLKVISGPEDEKLSHYIPTAKPFVTQLSAIATDVVRKNDCNLIYSSYLEPYSIAAFLTSTWTKVPFVVSHAGSDLGGLFLQKTLMTSYIEVLKAAKFIVTDQGLTPFFKEIGIPRKKLIFFSGTRIRPAGFKASGVRLDVNSFLSNALKEQNWLEPCYKEFSKKKFNPNFYTIGMYGKIHVTKGSYDLLFALSKLKRKYPQFQLLVIGSETTQIMKEFVDKIKALGLAEHVWLLPFIPHWRIPEFIRATDVICYLERNFDIGIHNPSLIKEVFDCGKCLIISEDMKDKFIYSKNLKDKENVLAVDPNDHTKLADAIEWAFNHPKEVKEIGRKGGILSNLINTNTNKYLNIIDREFQNLAR